MYQKCNSQDPGAAATLSEAATSGCHCTTSASTWRQPVFRTLPLQNSAPRAAAPHPTLVTPLPDVVNGEACLLQQSMYMAGNPGFVKVSKTLISCLQAHLEWRRAHLQTRLGSGIFPSLPSMRPPGPVPLPPSPVFWVSPWNWILGSRETVPLLSHHHISRPVGSFTGQLTQ